MFVSSTCSLRQCIQGSLDADMAQVHVQAYDVSREDVKHMEVMWCASGTAEFHDICWKAAMDSVKMDNPFCLSPLEKDLLLVAKKSAEYFDSMDKVRAEAQRISHMIRTSNYAVAFTGAGISTAAGIGDFRGKCGKWTEREREKNYGASRHRTSRDIVFESRRPTYSHEALCCLLELGYIKHIISQNTDGLHRLSGVPREKLSELHGNSFHERCEKCGTRYERPHVARRIGVAAVQAACGARACVHCHFDHSTGVMCDRKGCDGYLMNCIINFGDSLEKKVLTTAGDHARQADAMLCLGTSLRVAPACDLVEMGVTPLRVAICNRQQTPMDRLCYITGDCPANGSQPSYDVAQKTNVRRPTAESSPNLLASQPDKSNVNAGRPQQDSSAGGNATDAALSRTSRCLGSRVFGNCDDLMREVVRLMLSDEEMKGWMDGMDRRREEYERQRRVGGTADPSVGGPTDPVPPAAVEMEISRC